MSQYNLTLSSIDELISDLNEFFKSENADKKDAIRISLTTEEMLLQYRDAFGENIKVEMTTISRFLKIGIQLQIFCEKMNPFTVYDDAGLMKSLLASSTQQNPIWKYIKSSSSWVFSGKSCNEITLTIPKKDRVSSPLKICAASLVAVVLALVTKLCLTTEQCSVLAEDFILPISNVYTGFLGVMSVLLVFFSLPLTMVQYGNVYTFQKNAKGLLKYFIIVPLICVIVFGIISASLINSGTGGGSFVSVAKSVLDVIIGFIPNNLVDAFLKFNGMQILIIGFTFGICFLVMGNESKPVVDLFDRINLVSVISTGYLARFVHFYVGIMIFYFVITDHSSDFASVLPIIILTLAFCIIALIVYTAVICIRFKIRPHAIIKRFLPSFMINITTANVGTAFSLMFSELVNECGVDPSFNSLALNFGSTFFKPLYSLFLAVSAVFAAYYSNCLSVGMLIQIVLLSYVLSFTIPNIQGGAASVILLMFSQLGLASQMANIIVSINTLLQFVIIPVNIYCLMCATIIHANREGKLSIDVLRK